MAFIKFLFKTLFNLIILIFLLLICIFGLAIWFAPKISPKLIDNWIESKTGFTASINEVNLKFFSGTLHINNIALGNPPYYQNKNLMQINQFSAKLAFKPLLKKQIVFDEMLIDIERLTWVRNTQGSINVLEFLSNFKKTLPVSSKSTINPSSDSSSPPKSPSKYLIKKLTLRLNSIDIVGFPNENDSQNLSLNFHRDFSNVTDIEEVIKSIAEDVNKQGLSLLAQEVLNLPVLNKIISAKSQKDIQKAVEKIFPDLKKLIK